MENWNYGKPNTMCPLFSSNRQRTKKAYCKRLILGLTCTNYYVTSNLKYVIKILTSQCL